MRKFASLVLFGAAALACVARASDSEPEQETDVDSSMAEEAEVEELVFEAPETFGALFVETFQTDVFEAGTWIRSKETKYSAQEVDVGVGSKGNIVKGDTSLVLAAPAKHYGLSAAFEPVVDFTDKDLVFQYELRLHEGLDCGGAYFKLLAAETMPSLDELKDDTPYVIMFGPDKCGATNKIHFIFRHQNPVSGEWEEKHLRNPPGFVADDATHLFTLVVRADNTFEILVDGESRSKGSLLEDFEPPVNPEREIDDPEDVKPEDWVDEAQIPDPEAEKPEDWDEDEPMYVLDEEAERPEGWLEDEPDMVPDPEAEMPEDWDEDEDGDWEPPMVPNPRCEKAPGCGPWERPNKRNPEYKGKWEPPMIDNPAYKGEWSPRRIANPHFFTDEHPHNMPAIGGAAIEVWTMSAGIAFDNVFVGNSQDDAKAFADQTFFLRRNAETRAEAARQRAAAQREREEALARGGIEGYVTYAIGEATDLVVANPVLFIGAGFALLVGLVFLCVRSGAADDSLEEELREMRRQATEEAAKRKAEATAESKSDDAKDGSGSEADADDSTPADGAVEQATAEDDGDKPATGARRRRRREE